MTHDVVGVAAPILVAACFLAFFGAIGLLVFLQIRGTRTSRAMVVRQAVWELQAGRAEVQLPVACGMSPEQVAWFAEQHRYAVREWPGAYRGFYVLVPAAPRVAGTREVPHPPQPPPPLGDGHQLHAGTPVGAAPVPVRSDSVDRQRLRRQLAQENSRPGVKYRIVIVAGIATLFAVLSVEAYLDGNDGYFALAMLSAIAYVASLASAIQFLAARKSARR